MQMDAATDSVVITFSSDFSGRTDGSYQVRGVEFYDSSSLKVVISNLVIDYQVIALRLAPARPAPRHVSFSGALGQLSASLQNLHYAKLER
jgi:hypothetical protein